MKRSIRLILWIALTAVLIFVLAVCCAEDNSFTEPGSIVTFGRYPQEADGKDKTPIECIVLEYDETSHRALLLSRYGLDVKPYHNSDRAVKWKTSSIRSWLNGAFLITAFTDEERKLIPKTEVDNSNEQGYSGYPTDGGENTQDYIFLLSYAEVRRFFGVQYYKTAGSQNLLSRMAPTAYALGKGADTYGGNKTEDGVLSSVWWLRSPGLDQNTAARVNAEGSLDSKYVYRKINCVRPALWISLE